MSTPHITLVRQQLLDTLIDLRNREQPLDIDRARAVAQVDRLKAEMWRGRAAAAAFQGSCRSIPARLCWTE